MGDGVAEILLRFANRDGNGNRQAALARAAKRTVADNLGRQLHVRIGENNDVILRTALALHALAAGRGPGIDVFGDRRGTNEADGADLRMIAERVDYIAAAVDEIHDPFGQAGLVEKFEGAAHRERNALGWFQYEGISAGDGIR